MSHFELSLDLPHAGTVAIRIVRQLERVGASDETLERAREVVELLMPFRVLGENPTSDEAPGIVSKAALLGRAIVDAIEREGVLEDRLGQCIRNLFECLALGEEGAAISLRAGEDPRSPMRP